MSESQQEPVQDSLELPANTVSPITIENYLKDLMAIPRPRVDNSELLDIIDRASSNLSDCINLVESTLRKRKSDIKHKETSPQSPKTGDIDDKIAYYIKLAEDTLNSGRSSEQEEPGLINPWATGEYNPQTVRSGTISFEPNAIHSLGPSSEDIFPELSDIDRDRAFIDYLR